MDKLQELTDRLYNEGLSKGRKEGEAILEEAAAKAAATIEKARKDAEAIVAKARREAADLMQKAEADIKTAAAQAMQATKKDIETLIVGRISASEIAKAMSAPEFIKEIIKAVAEKFNAEEAVDLNLVLPESLRSELEPFVKNELSRTLKGGVDAAFSKKIAGGFNIGPKDGGYFISLTDETLKELITEYLRPATKKILFGE